MKDYRTHHFPKRDLGTQFRHDMIFVIVGCFILYIFQRFLSFLFKPLQVLSPEEINEKFEEKIAEKRDAREIRLERINKNVSDPMYQYLLRFVEKPEDFKKDPDNKMYYRWFQEWKKGHVIDSTLRWVPNIFKNMREEINPVFIDYMKIQLDLHKKASLIKRMIFSNTLYKYYPELSHNLKNLEHDLAHYEAEIASKAVHRELQIEIQKFGLPDNIADYLSDQNMKPGKLRRTAKAMKGYIEKGVSSDLCIFAHEHNLNENMIAAIHLITDQTDLPPRAGYAYLKNELTIEEAKELNEHMQRVMETYGNEAFEIIENKGKTAYDEILDHQLKHYRAKKILKKG